MLEQTRREMIKSAAVTATAAAAGVTLPGHSAEAQGARSDGIRWDKGVCRFCGTGCGVLVGTKAGNVVATQGDPDAPVNRGLNCIKGYFLSKIMYGEDRLTKPLLRMKNGKFDKNGEFHAGHAGSRPSRSWPRSGRRRSRRAARRRSACSAPASGRSGRAMRRPSSTRPASAPTISIPTRATAWPRRSPASCAPSASTSRWAATTTSSTPTRFVLWGANMAEMHPILWSRLTDRRLTHPGCEVHVLSTFEHRCFELADNQHRVHAAERSGDPQLHRQLHHPERRGEPGLRRASTSPSRTRSRTSATGCGPTHPLEVKAVNASHKAGKDGAKDPAGMNDISFEQYKELVAKYTRRIHREAVRRRTGPAGEAGQALCRPEEEGRVLLDHGLQPAHPRHLGEQSRLQHPSADRKDLRARQRPVLAHRPAVGLRHRARGRHLRAPPAGRHGRHQSRRIAKHSEKIWQLPRGHAARAISATTRWCRTACSRTASSTPTGSSAPTTCRRRPT